MRLSSFKHPQDFHQGNHFSRRGGRQDGRTEGAGVHPRRIHAEVHRSVAENNGKWY